MTFRRRNSSRNLLNTVTRYLRLLSASVQGQSNYRALGRASYLGDSDLNCLNLVFRASDHDQNLWSLSPNCAEFMVTVPELPGGRSRLRSVAFVCDEQVAIKTKEVVPSGTGASEVICPTSRFVAVYSEAIGHKRHDQIDKPIAVCILIEGWIE
jgi:hypothetical protein